MRACSTGFIASVEIPEHGLMEDVFGEALVLARFQDL